jgi:hypothetical protein
MIVWLRRRPVQYKRRIGLLRNRIWCRKGEGHYAELKAGNRRLMRERGTTRY